jgi:acid phosphatase family membrane protein YuiD
MFYSVLNTMSDYKWLWVPVGSWFVAQLLKLIIVLIKDRYLDFSYLVSMGGMPSAHSALVCSLATTAAKLEGLDSPIFALAACFALVVMYDAGGVRQTVGKQSNILNRILDELFKGNQAFEQRLRELIGHSRLEIVAGAILGILLAMWWA